MGTCFHFSSDSSSFQEELKIEIYVKSHYFKILMTSSENFQNILWVRQYGRGCQFETSDLSNLRNSEIEQEVQRMWGNRSDGAGKALVREEDFTM